MLHMSFKIIPENHTFPLYSMQKTVNYLCVEQDMRESFLKAIIPIEPVDDFVDLSKIFMGMSFLSSNLL